MLPPPTSQMPAPVQTTYDPTSISERPVALPNEPIRRITERLSIQPPLSRRGHGPAVLIFLPAEGDVPPLNEGRKPLDPEPVQKWAEEGFAVAFVRLSEDLDVRQIMGDAAKALIDLDDSLVDTKDKFGVIGRSHRAWDRHEIDCDGKCMGLMLPLPSESGKQSTKTLDTSAQSGMVWLRAFLTTARKPAPCFMISRAIHAIWSVVVKFTAITRQPLLGLRFLIQARMILEAPLLPTPGLWCSYDNI